MAVCRRRDRLRPNGYSNLSPLTIVMSQLITVRLILLQDIYESQTKVLANCALAYVEAGISVCGDTTASEVRLPNLPRGLEDMSTCSPHFFYTSLALVF